MQLARYRTQDAPPGVALVEGETLTPLSLNEQFGSLADILAADDPAAAAKSLMPARPATIELAQATLLAPIDRQEVWAAGVTYRRSKVARMEESEGAARFYDLVYEAPRPEIFFKTTPHRVVGPGQPVRIRRDSRWNVPEPELALVLNPRLQLVGFTIGNDMSSRDIEGENPLYLPQAKTYDGCCALGPVVTLAAAMPAAEQIGIRISVRRGGNVAFSGETSVGRMARTFDELIGWLGREASFPDGAFLLTGTGIVPGDDFTLALQDVVEISIDGIGLLSNPVSQ